MYDYVDYEYDSISKSYISYYGWFEVEPTPEKYEFVNSDDELLNVWKINENKTYSKPPTRFRY